MKQRIFRKQNDIDDEWDDSLVEKPPKKEYIMCFPPKEPLAGNFFSQIKTVWQWTPAVQNIYTYDAVGNRGKEERIEDITCLFMESIPKAAKGDGIVQWRIGRKIKKFAAEMETSGFLKEEGTAMQESEDGLGQEYPVKIVCNTYEMASDQDYPYSLRLYFAWDFFERLTFDKRTRVGIIEGNALSRRDLIALIRQYYDRMNYLTVFSKEPAMYQELAEDAWEQFGLAVTVTKSMGEVKLCDYILDCTVLPFEDRAACRKGCRFFSIYAGQKKIRSIRRMGGNVRFDSCAASLDRAFHNKV